MPQQYDALFYIATVKQEIKAFFIIGFLIAHH